MALEMGQVYGWLIGSQHKPEEASEASAKATPLTNGLLFRTYLSLSSWLVRWWWEKSYETEK